jgi:hypothetical protein
MTNCYSTVALILFRRKRTVTIMSRQTAEKKQNCRGLPCRIEELVSEFDVHDQGTVGENDFIEFLNKHDHLVKKCKLRSLS